MIERETETEYDIAIFREIARVHSIYISDANNTTVVVTIYSSYNQHHIVM